MDQNTNIYKTTEYPHTFPRSGGDIHYNLLLSYVESIIGCTKEIDLKYYKYCEVCNGVGKFRHIICDNCNDGQIIDNLNTNICDKCEGYGIIYTKKCPMCKEGKIECSKIIKINIETNIKNGSKHIIRNINKGINGGENGDLYISIQINNDTPYTQINQTDIKYTLEIPLLTALLGNYMIVPTIYGKQCKVMIPGCSQHGDKIEIKQGGIYDKEHKTYGSMFVKLKVVLPHKLSNKQKQGFKSLLAN